MQKLPVVEQAEQQLRPFLADLEAIVNIDSGTYNRVGVNRVASYLSARFQALGFSTRLDPQTEYGDNLVAEYAGNAPSGPRILLIGHMDTVFPDGEAARRPFAMREQDGARIATGPGVLDMKSGLLIGMYGLHSLIVSEQARYRSLTFICNSDEEIGSPASKPLIQELARESDAVIVLEPGRALTTVVSSRRASGQYRIEVRGVAAHAGVEPHVGRNAILELAHQVQAVQALNSTIPGTSLNVGVIRGGERTNIVPDFAYCEIDVRASDQAGISALEAALHRITQRCVLAGTSISVSGNFRSQPFELTPRNIGLVRLAKEAGTELGLAIEDHSSGGASDANNTSCLDVATIDGLGAGGGLAHNPDEYVELDYLPTRIALLSNLVKHICNYYQSGHTL